MLTEGVLGSEGDEIGNVENVLLDPQGQIVAIIAAFGGFWGIGTMHIAVSWEKVTLIPDGLKIPVTEDNFDDYTFAWSLRARRPWPAAIVLIPGSVLT